MFVAQALGLLDASPSVVAGELGMCRGRRLSGRPLKIVGTCGRVRYRKRVRVDGRKISRVTR